MNRAVTGYLDLVGFILICAGVGVIFGWRVGLGVGLILFGIGCALIYVDAKKETKDEG